MSWLRHRTTIRWILGLCFGGIVFALGLFVYIFVAHDLGFILIGLAIFFMLLLVATTSFSLRRVYHRNRSFFGPRTITISEEGIVSDNPLGHAETTWDKYQQFRETKNLFLLYQSQDVIGILPKRVFATSSDLEQFKSLMATKIGKA